MQKVHFKKQEQFPKPCKRSSTKCEGRIIQSQLKLPGELLAPPLETKGRQFDLVEEKNYAFRRFNVIPDTEQDI